MDGMIFAGKGLRGLILAVLLPAVFVMGACSTHEPAEQQANAADGSELERLIELVKDEGHPDQVSGVYVEDVLALQVVQQPLSDPDFIADLDSAVTEFSSAAKLGGSIGLLAHNHLAGSLFFDLAVGMPVNIVYGNGNVETYRVERIYRFRALDSKNPESDFVNLETNERLTSKALFEQMYGGKRQVTFQTCIVQDGDDTWGRLFVIAVPD